MLWEQAEALTWGEAVLLLEEREEAQRRRDQSAAYIAWVQAALIARSVLEGSLGEVYESFPFWTEEEVRELKVEKVRRMLEGMAGRKHESPAPCGVGNTAAGGSERG